MSETFGELFEKSLSSIDMRRGSVFEGVVLSVDKNTGYVVIDTPLKSEGYVKIDEFLDPEGQLEVKAGDSVSVVLEAVEDGWGETRLSRIKAKRKETWQVLEDAFAKSEAITGVIHGKVKGGFSVDINGIRAFLPGSLIDMRPVRDTSHLEGKPLPFKVIKLDPARNNVVVSRRMVVESENSAEREAMMASLQEGAIVNGVVKNLTEYGAFVDLGGLDGLLHITDISWKRVKHPSEVLNVGQELQVKILRFDRERMRVSLGLKQLGDDPWVGIGSRYPINTRLQGKITNIADYGCFVEIEPGIEGLVHVSEMDWTNRNIHPSKVVQLGDEVPVMVLDIDEERRRISLGLKQCMDSPWQAFSSQHKKGDRIAGKIKSITDFGLFIGLDGGIDGLVHLSDISWHVAGEEAVRQYVKGQDVEAVVLSVDPERERISLGIKQLDGDPQGQYLSEHTKGSVVTGTVQEVDARSAVILLAEGVEAVLKSSDFSKERVDDLRTELSVGDTVEGKLLGLDRKTRQLGLSVRAKESDEEAEVLRDYSRGNSGEAASTTLGDLLKHHIGGDKAE